MAREGDEIDGEGPEQITWESLGLTLVAHAWGDPARPLVLLLHGFLDQGRSFETVAERLAERYRVVAPDHRGHGLSEHGGPGTYYHFPDYVLDLSALVERLGAEQIALVGHSMGASIAVYFAGAFPEKVSALALLDGIGPTTVPAIRGPQLMKRWIHDVQLARRREPALMADLDDVAKRLARMAPRATHERLLTIAPHAAALGDDGAWRWRFDALHQTRSPMPFDVSRFRSFLAAIEAPTLVIWGEHTPFKPADADQRAAVLGDATTYTMAGVGHNIHHERPAELAGVLSGFLDGAIVAP